MMTKIREGYKETEVGVIPEDWEVKELSEVSSFKQGFQISREFQYENPVANSIRYLYISDFFSDKNIIYVKDSDKYYHIEKNDICIANTGNTCGKSFRGAEGLLSNNMFMIFMNNNFISDEYYWHYLKSDIYWGQLNKYFNSAGQPHVGHKNMSILKITLPPLLEQQRIAEILSTTDSHIEKLDKTIEDYQLLKKGMMKKLLTEGIGHTEFKETEIGRIPTEWEVKRLGECFEFYGGYTASRAQLTDEGRLYLHYGDIHLRIRSYIDTNEDSRWMPRYNVEKVKNGALLDTGDIVFADASEDYEGVGKSVVIIKGEEEIVAGLHTIVGKDINESFDLNYKRYFLGVDYVRNQFRRLATGAKVYGISKGNIGQILVSIPCKEEQCVIGKTLARLERHIELLSNEKEELFLLKKSLMDKLLTGKVRVM